MVKYWLQKKAGAGFVTVDAGNDNKDGINLTDPFTASQKFADVTNWIHQLNTAYPGSFPDAATMPVWWAEWYASPLSNYTQDYNNAVKSYAMSQLLKAGGAVALAWGEQGDSAVVGGGGSAGIYSNTNQSGEVSPTPGIIPTKPSVITSRQAHNSMQQAFLLRHKLKRSPQRPKPC